MQAGSCQKHPGFSPIPASGCGQAPQELPAWGRGAGLGRAGLALEEVLVNGEGMVRKPPTLWGCLAFSRLFCGSLAAPTGVLPHYFQAASARLCVE